MYQVQRRFLFVTGMTTANMAQVFTDVKKKLITPQSRDNNGLEPQFKIQARL